MTKCVGCNGIIPLSCEGLCCPETLNGGVNYQFIIGSMNFPSFLERNILNAKYTLNAHD
jgi:hypothetical protein